MNVQQARCSNYISAQLSRFYCIWILVQCLNWILHIWFECIQCNRMFELNCLLNFRMPPAAEPATSVCTLQLVRIMYNVGCVVFPPFVVEFNCFLVVHVCRSVRWRVGGWGWGYSFSVSAEDVWTPRYSRSSALSSPDTRPLRSPCFF